MEILFFFFFSFHSSFELILQKLFKEAKKGLQNSLHIYSPTNETHQFTLKLHEAAYFSFQFEYLFKIYPKLNKKIT